MPKVMVEVGKMSVVVVEKSVALGSGCIVGEGGCVRGSVIGTAGGIEVVDGDLMEMNIC